MVHGYLYVHLYILIIFKQNIIYNVIYSITSTVLPQHTVWFFNQALCKAQWTLLDVALVLGFLIKFILLNVTGTSPSAGI